jgi:ATP-dependent DNA ligase
VIGDLESHICSDLMCEAVLDGEIVVLDSDGRPRFYDLLRRLAARADPGAARRS